MTQDTNNSDKSQVSTEDLLKLADNFKKVKDGYKKAITRRRLSNQLYDLYYQKYGDPKNPFGKKKDGNQ